jgi:hypothetical protein
MGVHNTLYSIEKSILSFIITKFDKKNDNHDMIWNNHFIFQYKMKIIIWFLKLILS